MGVMIQILLISLLALAPIGGIDARGSGRAIGSPKLTCHSVAEEKPSVRATFADVPGFKCEMWCYESSPDFAVWESSEEVRRETFTLLDCCGLPHGGLEMRHRVGRLPHVLIITTFTAQPGAVEIVAYAKVDCDQYPDARLPDRLPVPNLCCQLARAEGFHRGQHAYSDFINRCFIFTDKKQTFLDDTVRRATLYRPLDHPVNNPPIAQLYTGTWRPVPRMAKNFGAGHSPDRFVIPVMGVVSRDGKYLAAMANDSAGLMWQAYFHCVHNNPRWLPADEPSARQQWRMKVYVLKNDADDDLLARVARDFPQAVRLRQRASAK